MKKFKTVILIMLLIVSLPAQEYWKDYIHQTGLNNFDSPPLMFTPLTDSEVRGMDNYTVVLKDDKGNITEAVSFLNHQPNYYWKYYYDEKNRLIQRIQTAILPEEELPLSRLQYSYREGAGYVAAYYTYHPIYRQWSLKYLKESDGFTEKLSDYTPQEPDLTLQRKLDEINKNLEELQNLESRNILKKILGWR
jgi:hypothetical protein